MQHRMASCVIPPPPGKRFPLVSFFLTRRAHDDVPSRSSPEEVQHTPSNQRMANGKFTVCLSNQSAFVQILFKILFESETAPTVPGVACAVSYFVDYAIEFALFPGVFFVFKLVLFSQGVKEWLQNSTKLLEWLSMHVSVVGSGLKYAHFNFNVNKFFCRVKTKGGSTDQCLGFSVSTSSVKTQPVKETQTHTHIQ